MKGLKYEQLLRKAFGFAKDGRIGDRGCDFANLAEAHLLADRSLDRAKIGVGYALAILTNSIINEVADELEDGEYNRLEAFYGRVIESSSASDLSALIEEYESTVLDKYFDIASGIIKLK